MRVCMIPGPKGVSAESGINAVALAYGRYLPEYGVEFVRADQEMDLLAIHAGMTNKIGSGVPIVSILHGLYWTEDYQAEQWEYKANRDVISSLVRANQITVPSEWVAETIRRDVRVNPHVIGHGIEWEAWQDPRDSMGYVLWNKNRSGDVCDPTPVSVLAAAFPQLQFISTFANKDAPRNVKVTGTMDHTAMKSTVMNAGVYLATTKETFGIGILEAMASGIPVLGWRHGGVVDLVEHGVNGYLAQPGNYKDLEQGLAYCLKWRANLGSNGRELAKKYTWRSQVERMFGVFELAVRPAPPTVTVVIPSHNYGDVLGRAVESVTKQTFPATEIIIVDDGSTDNTPVEAQQLLELHPGLVRYYRQTNMGVANARNMGISLADSKYICCLDADDEISPDFLKVCVAELEDDSSLGLSYTRLMAVDQQGREQISDWPGEYNYDKFLQGQNQVPTCCVFRRDLWSRLGGYRQRYAPEGAGAEDAEFWLRMGSLGYKGKLTGQNSPMFIYHLGGRVSGNPKYREENWREWHPWVRDGRHPFASVATPENGLSHPVRQYDDPVVSVVIPVGPGHIKYLSNALDSLEAQTIRSWEAVLVNDSGDEIPQMVVDAYPYLKIVNTKGGQGAGFARNLGASLSRGRFLLFLDADDWLEPPAMRMMLEKMAEEEADVVYSDYFGHAVLDPKEINVLNRDGRIKSSKDDGQAVIIYPAHDYDCKLAQSQPEPVDGQVYVWCLVSSMLPKALHDSLGGFDESMESWEDWDYWIRAARKGACFERIQTPLVNYRFGSGNRRETGISNSQGLLAYMHKKREKEEFAMCNSCRGTKATSSHEPMAASRNASPLARSSGAPMSTDGMILVTLTDNNAGDHPVIGFISKTHYGYRSTGEEFYMREDDADAKPTKYIKVTKKPTMSDLVEERPETPPNMPLPPPLSVLPNGGSSGSTGARMDAVPLGNHGSVGAIAELGSRNLTELVAGGFINSAQLRAMEKAGVTTYDHALGLGVDGLESINGIGSITASKIFNEVSKGQ